MEYKKIGTWEAIVCFDEKESLYIISYDGHGGAFVCDSNLEKAERKFIEAMELSFTVRAILRSKEKANIFFN